MNAQFVRFVENCARCRFDVELAWFHNQESIAILGLANSRLHLALWTWSLRSATFRFVIQELQGHRPLPRMLLGSVSVRDGLAHQQLPSSWIPIVRTPVALTVRPVRHARG